jgi:hypothetical protein
LVVKCSWNPVSDWWHYPYGALLEITGEGLIYIYEVRYEYVELYIYMYI